jgi:hypothetical protein
MHVLPRVDGIEDGKNILSYYFSDDDRRILLSGEGAGVLEEIKLPAQAQVAQHQLPADSIFFMAAGMARVSKDDPKKEEGKEKPTPARPRAGPASSSQVTTGWLCEFKCAFSGTYDEVVRHEKTCVKRPPAPGAVEISTELSRHNADDVHGASQLTISASRFGGADEDRVGLASTEHRPVHSKSSPLSRVVTKDLSFNVERRRVVRRDSSYHSDPEGLARAKSAWIDFEEDEIGGNEVLLGAGCCFNDIEFLLQDAGFESNNFGNLTTVTKVSCYRLR